jgi:DNA-binding MarR family transcriptional regulator
VALRGSPRTPSLPTALSQALIAFTIEFDNEFEHRVEHHTGNRKGAGVWLTSMVMWSNFMRLIPAGGVPLRAVEANGRITNFDGLQRWGYIRVEPADQTVHPEPGGRRAQEVWRPLADEIEERWRVRFGDAAVDELRQALSSVADPALPLYLPVLGYADGMRAGHVRGAPGAVAEDLAALLSQALLAFTLEYEDESDLSLALSADVLRVLSVDGVPVRDMPARSGVSKEAITAAVGFLQRSGYAAVEPDSASGAKLVRLTDQGLAAQAKHARLAKAVERRWRKRLGPGFDRLSKALVTGQQLAVGLRPYPDGWRAARNPYRARTEAVLADPASALPRYPMVLHRGGYPDGS